MLQDFSFLTHISGPGSKLLEFAIESGEKREVEEVYLHVQTSNEEALSFYKKFGFQIVETIKDYYKRIEPRDCYVLQKSLNWESTVNTSVG